MVRTECDEKKRFYIPVLAGHLNIFESMNISAGHREADRTTGFLLPDECINEWRNERGQCTRMRIK